MSSDILPSVLRQGAWTGTVNMDLQLIVKNRDIIKVRIEVGHHEPVIGVVVVRHRAIGFTRARVPQLPVRASRQRERSDRAQSVPKTVHWRLEHTV